MLKRTVALLLALVLLLPAFGTASAAEDRAVAVDGGYLLYQISDGRAVITGYTGSPRAVVVPDYIDGAPVQRIENSALEGCGSMTSLSLPSGLKEIGNAAFMSCAALRSVNLPDGLELLDDGAFQSCYALTSIYIPGSVKVVNNYTFANCFGLQRVTLGEGLTWIKSNAFYYCTQFTTLDLPDSMNLIDAYAFDRCDSLSALTIGPNYNALGENSFAGCMSLSDVYADFKRSDWEWIDSYCSHNIFSSDPTIHCTDDVDNSSHTVTFNPRGGSVSTSSKTVKNGETYGTLPIPTWKNHTFDGWYTRPEGGAQILSTTPVSLDSDQALYARWLNAPEVHTLRFDANGGSVGTSSRNVTWGETYGVLPTPTRNGYTFLGWYTARSGGEYVDPLDTFTGESDQTLYAQWEQSGKTYTVTFNALGGNVTPASKQVTSGQSYGDLPTPIYRGHAFDGWYTQVSGGQRILSTHTVEITANQTLYAHWHETDEVIAYKTPTLDQLSYNFSNSTGGFGYSNTYNIPLERYITMYGNTQRARDVYALDTKTYWGGNCFGMSSTTNMFFQEGNGLSASTFRGGANLPRELSVGDRSGSLSITLREFIEAMQIGQRSLPINRAYIQNVEEISDMVRAVEYFRDTGMNPPIIEVFGENRKGSLSGHAIVGYDVVERSSTESWVMVYDCNYPNQERHVTLTRDGSGRYTGWSYNISSYYPTWGTGRSQSYMTFIPYSAYYQTWTERGSTPSAQVMLASSTDSYSVTDRDGRTVARVENGRLVSAESGVYPIIEVGETADGLTNEITGTSLWLPTDVYTVSNTDSASSEFEATLIHVDQAVSVSTTSSSVTLAVDDSLGINYARVGDANSSYYVTLRSSLDVGSGNVEMRGTTSASGVSLSQIGGSLYTEGGSNQSVSSLVVDGRKESADTLGRQQKSVTELVPSNPNGGLPFKDVRKADWFCGDVAYVYEHGLMNGTGATTFDPYGTIDRGMIATILYRMAGSPRVSGPYFDDVKAGDWYADAARWAVDNGIMLDVLGSFYPTMPIERQDIALTLYRYAVYEGWDVSRRADLSKFADVNEVDDYAKHGLAWANAVGLINGVGTDRLDPCGTTDRSMLAALLHRLCTQVKQ